MEKSLCETFNLCLIQKYMFWLLRKIFGLIILAVLVFFALQFQVGGRPLKDYAEKIYHSEMFQGALGGAIHSVESFLHKDLENKKEDGPAMDNLKDDEMKELEKVLKKSK